MARIEVVGPEVGLPAESCWAEWKPGLGCPNRAVWHVQNLDNAGYTRLCTLHRDGWATSYPEARVACTTLYTPHPSWLRSGNACCAHCGQTPESHHSDGRCYTASELTSRLRFSQRTGRWPGPDEGCEEDESGRS
jgi:hypothetical protein